MSRPISDYAIIGDTQSSALVAADGSMDWLCWPRHDSPAVLTRLLDDAAGGSIGCLLNGARATSRAYLEDTNILETWFTGDGGASALLCDLMPVARPAQPPAPGRPDVQVKSRVLRLLHCTEGVVSGIFRLRLVADFGSVPIQTAVAADGSIEFRAAGIRMGLRGSHAFVEDAGTVRMSFSLQRDERAFIALTFLAEAERTTAYDCRAALEDLDATQDYWRDWTGRLRYEGSYRPAVVRSALVLKLLTYSPTGAIVAAATTSLPESVPGNRNYDYRFSWIRDASFTVTAFCNLGAEREAGEYLRFLRNADHSGGNDLKLIYAIDGEVPPERELHQLPGWNGVGPVRVGNAAVAQSQYDIYGEFMAALHAYLETVGFKPPAEVSDGLHGLIRALAGNALRCRDLPDRGIWELRSGESHLLHTKAMLWVALDRAAKTGRRIGGFDNAELSEWESAAVSLRLEYEREAWNEARGAWMQGYGSNVLDASVLRAVLYGALDPLDPRTASSMKAIDRELLQDDLVYRYRMNDDALHGEEATFTACAFWRVGVLALAGRTLSAKALFERLLTRASDLGLYAEEIDAATGEQRGNFPQAFTHMCVINHAVRLEACISTFGLAA